MTMWKLARMTTGRAAGTTDWIPAPSSSFSGLPRESSEPCRHAKRDTKTAMTRANNALEFNNWIPAFGEDDGVEGGEDDGLGGRRTRTPSLTYLM